MSDISAVIALPNVPPDPLRPSRKPLPPGNISQGAFTKAPPPTFYASYLDSLLKGDGPSDRAPWPIFQEAGLDKQNRGTEFEGSQDRRSDQPSGDPVSTIWQDDKSSGHSLDLVNLPSLFFDSEFDLANPLTWESLGMLAESPSPSIDDNLHALTNHLDVLESHLVKEISKRSPMFFSALDNLQRLTAQSSACLEQIVLLQSGLRRIDLSVSQRGLRFSQAQHDLDIQRTVSRGIQEIQVASGALALANQMSKDKNWMGTLEALDAFGGWLSRQSTALASTEGLDTVADTKPTRQDAGYKSMLTEIPEDEPDALMSVESLASSQKPEARFDLTSLEIVKEMQDHLQPLIADTRGQIQTELVSRFLSVLSIESQQSGSDPLELADTPFLPVLPLLVAFYRCGGTEQSTTSVWRTACLRSIRDTTREVRSRQVHRHDICIT